MKKNVQAGSAMILAVFVLVILTSMGAALLFLSRTEVLMSQASGSTQQVFYASEGGLEDGRTTIFNINKSSPNPTNLTEELQALAGGDNFLDFDPAALQPVYDANGVLTGFNGFDDDVPLRGMTALADGWYAAFVNNDPLEGVNSVVDNNDRLLLTAIAVREDRTTEMTRALIERPDTFAVPPSTITILGPNAVFEGGKSNAKFYTGDDYGGHCPPGVAGEVPVVGAIGAASEAHAKQGVDKPANYTSGADSGFATVVDLTSNPNLPDLWTDCELLVELADIIKIEADLVGDSTTLLADLGTVGAPKVVFIEDDYDINGNFNGAGLLFVTGDLEMDGMASWQGPIFVVGKGNFLRAGAGNGEIAGSIVVADVSGPDRILFTADDCAGPDDIPGNADDGIAQSTYIVDGAGNSTTGYCSAYFTAWQGKRPFKILSFLQD